MRARSIGSVLAAALLLTACGGDGDGGGFGALPGDGVDAAGSGGGSGGATFDDVSGDGDVLLFANRADRVQLFYDAATTALSYRALDPPFRDLTSGCTTAYQLGVQPVLGQVTAELSQCDDPDGVWFDQLTVVVRDNTGTARYAFGIPGATVGSPRVSFDGRYLAMTAETPDFDEGGDLDDEAARVVYITTLDGRLLGELPFASSQIRWLGDNRLLAINPDGRGFRFVSRTTDSSDAAGYSFEGSITHPSDQPGRIVTMDVSPDGGSVAYAFRQSFGGDTYRDDVWIVDLGTLSERRIASTPQYRSGDNIGGMINVFGMRDLKWSPGGTSLYLYIGGNDSATDVRGHGAFLQVSTQQNEVIPLESDSAGAGRVRFFDAPGLRTLRHPDFEPLREGYAQDLWPVTEYFPIAGYAVGR